MPSCKKIKFSKIRHVVHKGESVWIKQSRRNFLFIMLQNFQLPRTSPPSAIDVLPKYIIHHPHFHYTLITERIITFFSNNCVQFYANPYLHQHWYKKMLKGLCSQGKPWSSSIPSVTSWQMDDKLQGERNTERARALGIVFPNRL